MKNNINQILEELYKKDPSLKEKENIIIPIIQTMIDIKPDIQIDENFKKQLKTKINEEIIQIKTQKYFIKNKMSKIFFYIFGSLGISAFAIIIITNFTNTNPTNNYVFANQIIPSKTNFGNIGNSQLSQNGGINQSNFASNSKEMITTKVASPANMMRDNLEIMPEIDPNFVREIYNYTFSGNLLDLKQNMAVYKKETQKNQNFNDLIKNINFNSINMSKFTNLNIGNITLNQDKEFGYSINIDFDNGSLNIYKNYSKWPQTDYNPDEKQIILEKEEIFQIANKFLKEYNIDLSSYGQPQIEQSYSNILAKYSTAKTPPAYVNNITTIIFPLIIDGNEISGEYGGLSGVRIEIDLKEKKVIGLNSLEVKNYLKSDYSTETNQKNILQVASVGGRYGLNNTQESDEKVKYINKNLINPKLKYISTYTYNQNTPTEFLVPAIIFEVENENNQDYTETITVPLVKDFYKYDNSGKIIGSN